MTLVVFLVVSLLVGPCLPKPPTLPHATVILSRHCVREPEPLWYCMPPGMNEDPQYFSAQEWPVFPGPPGAMLCTPRGIEIVQGQGVNYAPTLPTPIKFIADNVTRDIQTAQAYADGIGLESPDITVDGEIFEPTFCPSLPVEEANEAVRIFMEANPWTPELQQLVVQVQAVMGKGAGPLLQDVPEIVQAGLLTGGSCGGSEAAEAFLLELGTWGMGSQVGWGNVTAAELTEYLQLQVYNMWLENSGALAQNAHSNLLWHVRNSLVGYMNGPGGTTYYVGHDSDLAGFGALLNLSWQQPGYPTDTTNPGSALRFDIWFDNDIPLIELTHVGTQFYTTNGNLSVTPVQVAWSKNNWFTFDEFDSIVQSVVDWACVSESTTGAFLG